MGESCRRRVRIGGGGGAGTGTHLYGGRQQSRSGRREPSTDWGVARRQRERRGASVLAGESSPHRATRLVLAEVLLRRVAAPSRTDLLPPWRGAASVLQRAPAPRAALPPAPAAAAGGVPVGRHAAAEEVGVGVDTGAPAKPDDGDDADAHPSPPAAAAPPPPPPPLREGGCLEGVAAAGRTFELRSGAPRHFKARRISLTDDIEATPEQDSACFQPNSQPGFPSCYGLESPRHLRTERTVIADALTRADADLDGGCVVSSPGAGRGDDDDDDAAAAAAPMTGGAYEATMMAEDSAGLLTPPLSQRLRHPRSQVKATFASSASARDRSTDVLNSGDWSPVSGVRKNRRGLKRSKQLDCSDDNM
eukprot:GHVU01192391.1.p1 GENE.GHVU01192391.1~~GHVU01192391.1.p1  ORF type:complete len:363 (+),score=58.84 GHVU01192391.1:226-1314(+)